MAHRLGSRRQDPSAPARVPLVEDHPCVRHGLRALLEEEGWKVVGEAASGEAAVPMIERLQPDVVVMDCKLPGQGGAATTRQIRQRWPNVPVIAHSAYANETFVREMVAAGAKGYILKGDAPSAVLEALSASVRGGTRFSSQISKAAQASRGPTLAPRMLTTLATTINGTKRAERSQEWVVDLAEGNAERRPPSAQLRHSAGLVVAAVRMRLGDLTKAMVRTRTWLRSASQRFGRAEPLWKGALSAGTVFAAAMAGILTGSGSPTGMQAMLAVVASVLAGVLTAWTAWPETKRRRERNRNDQRE